MLELPMSNDSDEFQELLRQVREGSEDAARTLFERYGRLVLRTVRRNLPRELRAQLDSQDCAQDVWASFFAIPAERFTFDTADAFIAYLAGLTRNRVREHVRRGRTRKRDVQRELALNPGQAGLEQAASAATPSQTAIAEEAWQRLLEGLPERYRQVLVLLRQGCTQQEIADRLVISTRSVRRLIHRLAPEAVS